MAAPSKSIKWATPHASDCYMPTCILGKHDRHIPHQDSEGHKSFGECGSDIDESQWGGGLHDQDPCPEGPCHICIKDEDHDDDHACSCGSVKRRTDNVSRYKVGDRVVAYEDKAHGRITEVIDGKNEVYAIEDDNGDSWVGFEGDFCLEGEE